MQKPISKYWNRIDEKWNLVSLDDLKEINHDISGIYFSGYRCVKEYYTSKELLIIIIKRQLNKIKRICQQ